MVGSPYASGAKSGPEASNYNQNAPLGRMGMGSGNGALVLG
ncbi:hypothetical protein BH09ACT10_BH09ACT10_19590 [soil metagenome]